jgi:hypothetical protein
MVIAGMVGLDDMTSIEQTKAGRTLLLTVQAGRDAGSFCRLFQQTRVVSTNHTTVADISIIKSMKSLRGRTVRVKEGERRK